MVIHLVRHGETDCNALGIFGGPDCELTAVGEQQARNLGTKLVGRSYDMVFCSPLLRARRTLDLLGCDGVPVIFDDRLAERSPGSLEGSPYAAVDRDDYWNYYSDSVFGTAETIPSLFKRVFSFLDELRSLGFTRVLVVAHSGVSKAFYAYFNGVPEDGRLLNLGLGNTEVCEYCL